MPATLRVRPLIVTPLLVPNAVVWFVRRVPLFIQIAGTALSMHPRAVPDIHLAPRCVTLTILCKASANPSRGADGNRKKHGSAAHGQSVIYQKEHEGLAEGGLSWKLRTSLIRSTTSSYCET